jgi:2-dehydro-3-deoxyphosphogluconate aldolase/(4S)-4-hydroxy-2-oxoglutarate aldolase
VPLAAALVAGGVRVLEVTLRTPVALHCMEAMARVPEAIVGAGTRALAWPMPGSEKRRLPVRRQPRLHRDPGRGAAARIDLPLLPGVATASEVMAGQRRRLPDFLKLFPATAWAA